MVGVGVPADAIAAIGVAADAAGAREGQLVFICILVFRVAAIDLLCDAALAGEGDLVARRRAVPRQASGDEAFHAGSIAQHVRRVARDVAEEAVGADGAPFRRTRDIHEFARQRVRIFLRVFHLGRDRAMIGGVPSWDIDRRLLWRHAFLDVVDIGIIRFLQCDVVRNLEDKVFVVLCRHFACEVREEAVQVDVPLLPARRGQISAARILEQIDVVALVEVHKVLVNVIVHCHMFRVDDRVAVLGKREQGRPALHVASAERERIVHPIRIQHEAVAAVVILHRLHRSRRLDGGGAGLAFRCIVGVGVLLAPSKREAAMIFLQQAEFVALVEGKDFVILQDVAVDRHLRGVNLGGGVGPFSLRRRGRSCTSRRRCSARGRYLRSSPRRSS